MINDHLFLPRHAPHCSKRSPCPSLCHKGRPNQSVSCLEAAGEDEGGGGADPAGRGRTVRTVGIMARESGGRAEPGSD